MKQIPTSLEIEIDGEVHEANTVSEDLHIDEFNLNEEFIKQPGNFAWYAVIAAEAEAQRDKVKFELEILEADLDKQVRDEIELRGDKVTEKQVAAEILKKEAYREKKRNLLEAGRQLGVMKAVKEGFIQKKDMLISLGANLRNENDSNVRINKREEEEEEPKKPIERKASRATPSAVKARAKKKKKKEMDK